MGKVIHEDVYKDGPQVIMDNATKYIACSDEPADRDEAVNTYNLASKDVSSEDFGWSSAGDDEYNFTIGSHSNVPVSNGGDVTHLAIVDDSRLLVVTTTESLEVFAGGLFSFPSWRIKQRKG